jgi:hypothetical protein
MAEQVHPHDLEWIRRLAQHLMGNDQFVQIGHRMRKHGFFALHLLVAYPDANYPDTIRLSQALDADALGKMSSMEISMADKRPI